MIKLFEALTEGFVTRRNYNIERATTHGETGSERNR